MIRNSMSTAGAPDPARAFLLARAAFLACALLLAAPPLGAQPAQRLLGRYTIDHDYRPSSSVSRVGWLSDYCPELLGTPGDGRVYVFEGPKPGGTLFVAGGTHANEIAGIMAAVLIIETIKVEAGRVIVVPNVNNSAIGHLDREPTMPAAYSNGPAWIALDTPSGRRFFKYGSRATHLAHQGPPDPAGGYVHPESSEAPLPGWEFRNVNRAYPGRLDSGLTQKIAYAVTALLAKEKADVAFDCHEADYQGRLAFMMVAHPKNIDAAALAVTDLELKHGLGMKLEPSNLAFRGLSHREWGASTGAMAFLVETPNPAMVEGAPRDADVVNDPRATLGSRVATHVACIGAVVDVYDELYAGSRPIRFTGLPSFEELTARGVGPFLK